MSRVAGDKGNILDDLFGDEESKTCLTCNRYNKDCPDEKTADGETMVYMCKHWELKRKEFESVMWCLKEMLPTGWVTDKKLAELLGIKYSTYATAKSRGRIPYKKIIDFCIAEGLSLDLVFRALGYKHIKPNGSLPD